MWYFPTQSAVRVRPVWEAYLGELLIIAGLMLYIVNYITGRSKNSSLAQAWYVGRVGMEGGQGWREGRDY